MYFAQAVALALVGVAQAVNVQVVSVGRNAATNATGLKFWPEKVTAEPGTMIQFQFWAGNHTVTQSTFDDPCIPIGNVNSSIEGVYSGYQPVAASMSKGMIPTYTITVKDTKPMWLFCSQAKHCQGGMSMVINENTSANSSRSLDNYKTLCKDSTAENVVPVQAGSGGGSNGGNGSDSGSGSGSGNGSGSGTGSGSGSGDESSGDGTSGNTPTGVTTPGVDGTPTSAGGQPAVTAAAAELSAPISLLLAVGAAVACVL